MMRRTALLLGVAMPVLIQSASAVAQREPIPDWTIETWVNRNDGQLETPARQTYHGYDRSMSGWIQPDDVPEALRRRRINTQTLVAIEIDPAGRATGCRVATASAEPQLDAIACPLLTARGHFTPQRRAPGETAAATWGVQVYWRVLDRAQVEERNRRMAVAPPAPMVVPATPGEVPHDRRWPRLSWYGIVRPAALPDLQAAYPRRPGRPAEGTTSLDLVVDPANGITGCEVGISSGNPRLDELACAQARTMRLTYGRSCDIDCRAERLPMQFVWARRGSHVRLPLLAGYTRDPEPIRDPADTRTSRRYQSYRRIAPAAPFTESPPANRSHSNRYLGVRYTIGTDGLLQNCRISESSGNPAFDQWYCRRLRAVFRYAPRTDVFGTPVAEEDSFRLDLDRAR